MLEKTKIYRTDDHTEAPADKYSTAFYSDIWVQKKGENLCSAIHTTSPINNIRIDARRKK